MADDAGALLVRTGLITDQDLLAARQSRAQAGGTIGEHLVLSGIVADEALTEFYRSRLLVPRVNPNTLARLPSHVVEAIPVDMAIEFRCVPVALDKEGNLTVAMSDPSDSHAVDEVGFFTSKYVVRAVATQMQIAWCLAHYYGHITELGRRLLKPSTGSQAVATAAPAAEPAAPEQPTPRVRGFTGRVEASRHKVLPPVSGESPSDAPRPSSVLLVPTAEDLAKVEAVEAAPVAAAPETSEPYAQVEVAAPTHDLLRAVDEGDTVVVHFDDEPAAAEPAAAAPPLVTSSDDIGRTVADEEMRPIAEEEEDDDADWDAAAWAAARESAERATTEPGVDPDEPAVIHVAASTEESAPILLVQKRPVKDTLPEADEAADEPEEPVVLLDRKKASDPPPPSSGAVPADSIADAIGGAVRAAMRRPEKRTQVGLGLPAVSPRPATQPPALASTATSDPVEQVAVAEVAGARPWSVSTPADGVPTVMEEGKSDQSTRPHTGPATPPEAPEVDDGWGPPGTTIPPPFLGALPGTESGSSETIPLSEDSDGQPLLIAGPPAPAPAVVAGPVDRVDPVDPIGAARAMEQASTKLVELLRRLDHAASRDEVIDSLLGYLALSHERVAFLAVKNGAVSPFLQRPPAVGRPAPTLSLDVPSTLQDVVGTRLPYRGAIADDASRMFLTRAFEAPPGEALMLPISIRDRVIAVLYGDGRQGRGFEEHFAIAGRAAGLALERILQTKRASTQP